MGVNGTSKELLSHNIITYTYNIKSAEVNGYIEYYSKSLTVAFFNIVSKNSNDGASAFIKYWRDAKILAMGLNLEKFELLGIAVINKRISKFLLDYGFIKTHIIIPEELGDNGKEEAYQKTIWI